MKKITLLMIAGLMNLLSIGQTFTGGGGSIPDWSDTYFDLTVSGLGGTDVLTSVCVNISHGFNADLDIYLVDPLGNEYELSTDQGGANYTGTCFTNTAGTSITAGAAPYTGNFIPECGSLPTGLYPNAVWRLHIYDDALFDGGSLTNWSLTFSDPPCPTIGFNGLPATLNCNSAAVTMYANDSAVANGAIYPSILFQYSTDDYGTENGCRIWESSTSSLLYEDLVLNVNEVLTVYATGPLMSPSETYTTEIYESYGDGGIELVVYDGNGTVYDTYVYPVGSTGWITRGPYVPAGSSSWTATGAGITATTDWGAAIFNPAVAGPGVHTITYCFDNEAGCSGCMDQVVTVLNPFSAAWTSPGTICASDGNVTLAPFVTGNTGGTWSGTGVWSGAFHPSGLSGDYNVTYSVGSGGTCVSTETHVITVIPVAIVEAGANGVVCNGETYTVSGASYGGSATTCSWTTSGTGSFTGETTLTPTYTPSGADIVTGFVTLTLTATGPCATVSDFIFLNFHPTYFTAEEDSVCDGDSINYHGTFFSTAGLHTVTLETEFGCDSIFELTLTLKPAPTITSVVSTDVTDCASPNGSLVITATGGSSVQYSIDGGATYQDNGTFTGLMAGTYPVVVLDASGCSESVSSIVSNVSGAAIDSVTIVGAKCFGDNSGQITIYSSTATQFSIDGGSTFAPTNLFYGLYAGSYDLVIEDDNNCQAFLNDVLITEPDSMYFDSVIIASVLCYGENTGSIEVFATGGTPGYIYNWYPSGTGVAITDLAAGGYSVTVSDVNGCDLVRNNIQVTQPAAALETLTTVDEIQCFDGTGSITLDVSGGTPPYIYFWSDGSTSSVLPDINAGLYNFTVTDGNGCTTTGSLTLTEPEALQLQVLVIDPETCPGTSDGSIDIAVTGGTGTYSTLWSNSTTNEDLSNATTGVYFVTVTDLNGCLVVDTLEMTSEGSVSTCIEIPDVFTPNSDGINDTWEIAHSELIGNLEIEVFNRWGQLIFSFKGTGSEYLDVSKRWDGTYNGSDCPFGAYVYILKMNDDEPINGLITIIR